MQCPDHLVERFDQHRLIGRLPEELNVGMSVGLSLFWLDTHRTYKNATTQRVAYIAFFAAQERVASGQRGFLQARTPTNRGSERGELRALNAACKAAYGSAKVCSLETIRLAGGKLTQEMNALFVHTSGIHEYYLIALSFERRHPAAGDDIHFIAAYHSGGKFRGWGSHLYVFDPNFGEFKLSGGEVKGFFRQLIDAYQGEDNGNAVKAITVYRIYMDKRHEPEMSDFTRPPEGKLHFRAF
jgi:hypothetical protein